MGGGTDDAVRALQVFDDGSGEALYAGGLFSRIGNTPALHIARWRAGEWTSIGSGTDNDVYAMCVHDDGNGAAIYAAGIFNHAGGIAARGVAKWIDEQWHPLANGVGLPAYALASFDDGLGPALFVGGGFTSSGNRIAKWTGTQWLSLGSGLSSSSGGNVEVKALTVHNDGSGHQLYVGGRFDLAGGTAAGNVARWNGSSWSAVGAGFNDRVEALAVYDDGLGEKLYAAGSFTSSGSQTARRIAKWDGQQWSEVGGGTTQSTIQTLWVHNHGLGDELYVSGFFDVIGGVSARSIAKWNGQSWSPLGSGSGAFAYGMQTYDDGNGAGPALFVGGAFSTAGGELSNNLARWGRPYPIPGDFDHDCDVDISDLTLLLASYGRCAGDEEFFADADFDADGCIGLPDLTTFLSNFGRVS